MRILLIMDPDIPVPPPLYGGIERIVYLLAEEYTRLGHQVTVLSGPNTKVSCKTVIFGSNGRAKPKFRRWWEIIQVWNYLIRNQQQVDVIHNFGRLVYFLPLLASSVKKVMSYQREITKRNIRIVTKLPHKNLFFTANSNSCAATGNVAGLWKTVYNGVLLEQYTFQAAVADDAPLIFLGRLETVKAPHLAIEIAKKTNHKLILAGNYSKSGSESIYFRKRIAPFVDGKQIIYAGELDDEGKNHYLGQSKALIFPIQWEEPFGIVMIESFACGTPVIAFNRGAVPEVVEHGITGFICSNVDDMAESIAKVGELSRKRCRIQCENRFSSEKIAKDYLHLFQN